MTPIEKLIAESRKIAAAASPAPWDIESGTYGVRLRYLDVNYDYPSQKYYSYLGCRDKFYDSYNLWHDDAKFIVRARNTFEVKNKIIGVLMKTMNDLINSEDEWESYDYHANFDYHAKQALDQVNKIAAEVLE